MSMVSDYNTVRTDDPLDNSLENDYQRSYD
jgi:hypothetical protein